MSKSNGDVLKVVVADDHALYRAGLRELLEEEEVEVVSEASTGEEAVQQAIKTQPDVVVMDVRMPGMDGIEASRQIKQRLPRTQIVMITGVEHDQEQLLRAIDAGARSYIGKDDDPRVIVEAVRSASQGGAYLSPEAVRQLLDKLSQRQAAAATPARPGGGRLTDREKDVLRLVAKGLHNREIAKELGLSVRSIGNHMAKIYAKLHIHARSEAVRYAIKHGIAPVE
jgi:DNA-binding NarL/FixJ family response regulator